MEYRYFLIDCFGLIVGNHKGYKSERGVNIALSKSLRHKLWARYDEALKNNQPIAQRNLVYKFELRPVA